MYQKGMNFALDRLNDGQWVHIFPEGVNHYNFFSFFAFLYPGGWPTLPECRLQQNSGVFSVCVN